MSHGNTQLLMNNFFRKWFVKAVVYNKVTIIIKVP